MWKSGCIIFVATISLTWAIFTLFGVKFLNFDKYIWLYEHQQNPDLECLLPQKVPVCPFAGISLHHLQPVAAFNLFLHFRNVIEMDSDNLWSFESGFFSLSVMHVRFILVTTCISSSFLFLFLGNILLGTCTAVCLSIHRLENCLAFE